MPRKPWKETSRLYVAISDSNQPGNPVGFLSPALLAFLGYPEEGLELNGRTLREVLDGGRPQREAAGREAVARFDAAVRAGEQASVVLRCFKKSHESFWAHLTALPVSGGGKWVWTLRVVTCAFADSYAANFKFMSGNKTW